MKTASSNTAEMRLFDRDGHRLYLNSEERALFLSAARNQNARYRTICETLHFTGCRESELIEITPARIDLSAETVTLRTLKKRKRGGDVAPRVYRQVPVPSDYLDTLNTAHGIREAQKIKKTANAPIFDLSRQRVWQIVKSVMIEAGISDGPHRTVKGLRHSYGVNAIVNEVPLNMLQKWMGHADISTTAIYANAVGREERDIAGKMWG